MEHWYEKWDLRLQKEEFEMQKRFPKLQLKKLDDGKLAWIGLIELPNGLSFNIAIVYPAEFPFQSPRVYPIDSRFTESLSEVPHLMSDGSLCLSYPNFNSPNATAADVATGAFLWLQHFAAFTETGHWQRQTTRKKKDTGVVSQRTKVFISYSHTDVSWLERLRVHLKSLEREGRVDVWDDTKIQAGDDWRQEIEKAINTAKVAVLLISADFLASDFIQANELPPLLRAAEEDGAVILPVIVSPSRFLQTGSLSRFQAVNPPSKPLSSMTKHNQEKLFVKLSVDIEAALNLSEM